GTPTTRVPAGTSRVTTAPAPMRAPSPIVTPPTMTAPEPMLARRCTIVVRVPAPAPFVDDERGGEASDQVAAITCEALEERRHGFAASLDQSPNGTGSRTASRRSRSGRR